MDQSFAIGFIIFNPPSTFIDRLNLLLKIRESTILVFDNSPANFNSNQVAHLAKTNEKLLYSTDGYNVGLSRGFEKIKSTCISRSIHFLLFFDQDTAFTERTVEFVRQSLLAIGTDRLHLTAAISFSGHSEKDKSTAPRVLQNRELIVNSGILIVIANLDKLKWPNKLFFVECLDYYFCLMSKIKKYPILRIKNTPDFDHFREQDVTFQTGSEKKATPRRIYSFRRTMEYIKSSFILIGIALTNQEFRYAAKFVSLVLVFIMNQVFLVTLKVLTNLLKGAPRVY